MRRSTASGTSGTLTPAARWSGSDEPRRKTEPGSQLPHARRGELARLLQGVVARGQHEIREQLSSLLQRFRLDDYLANALMTVSGHGHDAAARAAADGEFDPFFLQ